MGIKDEILVIILSLLPISELRGAIPIGLAKGLNIGTVFFLAIIGNFLPVLPLLLFFKYTFHKMENIKLIGHLWKKWKAKVEKKSPLIETFGFWGIVLFVAVPSPFTGAWTASFAAHLFGFKLHKACLAIFIGVVIAGVIVSVTVTGVVKIGAFFMYK